VVGASRDDGPPDSAADDRTADDRTSGDRRADVVSAALALFAERGYEATTADDIAERAHVSRRTFFYYFRSKSDVLFSASPESLTVLGDLVAAQPPACSELDAVERAWIAFPEWSADAVGDSERRRVVQLLRAAIGSVILRGKQHDLHAGYERALAGGLARRRGLAEPDGRALLAAAVGQTLMSRAVLSWVSDERLDRAAAIRREFAAARLLLEGGPD
jgi:AcrR family transcriptional regulator